MGKHTTIGVYQLRTHGYHVAHKFAYVTAAECSLYLLLTAATATALIYLRAQRIA